jgi:hypothetical protein
MTTIKPCITCHLNGGLGNQLFQIFITLRNALKFNKQIVFMNTTFSGRDRNTYWTSLLDKMLDKYILSFNYSDFKTVIREKSFKYTCIESEILSKSNSENILLAGYFQSPKYFQDAYSIIYDFLGIAEKRSIVREKMDIDFSQCVSMHFRLGDYKHLQTRHPILKIEYYLSALQHVSLLDPTIKYVLYCCEQPDIKDVKEKISILENKFPQLLFTRISNDLADWEQMLAMSCCKHHIIANSTFSWWAAYLNASTSNKIVCYPSTWFGPALKHHNTSDLFPEEWTKIV